MNSLTPAPTSSSSSADSESSSSHAGYSLSRLHSLPSNPHTPSSKPARPLPHSFFSSSSSKSSKEARSSVALSGPRPSTSSSSSSTQSDARPPSRRFSSVTSSSIHTSDVFGQKGRPGGVNLAANLAFGGTQKPQSGKQATVARVQRPQPVNVTHRRNSSVASDYSTTSSVSSSSSQYSFYPTSPSFNSDGAVSLKPFAKKARGSLDLTRPSIDIPQPIDEAPESLATTYLPNPVDAPFAQPVAAAPAEPVATPPVAPVTAPSVAPVASPPARSPEQIPSPIFPPSQAASYFEPIYDRFKIDFARINSKVDQIAQEAAATSDQEDPKPQEEEPTTDTMGLVRNFTKRSSLKRESAASPPQRPQISLPVNLISSTNMESFRAPDITDAQKTQDSPSSATSSGRSAHSSVDETDMSAITEPNLTDASSAASSLSSSPVENKSFLTYFSPLSKKQEAETTRIVDTSEPISTGADGSESEIIPPALPKRAPSHSKREHFRLSRMRSIRSTGTTTTESRDFAEQSADYNADDDDSSPGSSPRSRQHPFSHELEQLDEVAEEFSASAVAAMYEEDEKVMHEQGLVAFTVDDYLDEIRADESLWFPDSPAVLRQVEEGWI